MLIGTDAIAARGVRRYIEPRTRSELDGVAAGNKYRTGSNPGANTGPDSRTLTAARDRSDHRATPSDGDHHYRAHVAKRKYQLRTLKHRLGARVGNENRLPTLEGTLELRIPLQVYDEVAQERILVRRHQPNIALFSQKEDRAAIQAERLAEAFGDGLQDVHEMKRRRDLGEYVDHGDQLVAFPLELRDSQSEPVCLVS